MIFSVHNSTPKIDTFFVKFFSPFNEQKSPSSVPEVTQSAENRCEQKKTDSLVLDCEVLLIVSEQMSALCFEIARDMHCSCKFRNY